MSLQGTTTQTPGLSGGNGDGAGSDGRLRGGFDAGSQETDHYGDGSSNANSDGNSSKNLSDEKSSESPVSQESVGTSDGSNLKTGPSTSMRTASELHRPLVLDTPR